jgi:hypothetical protein
MEKVNNIEQGFVEQDTALESMRASDFDCYSAYGEVIDNSIQAYATDIRILIEEKNNRENSRSKKIGQVIFADNGTGMDIDLLHKCLKLGHSSRYNDRSGIGRFGVGMTLGAIHECRRIDVYSKVKNDNWYYTYIDLDEIKNGTLKLIPRPVQKNPNFEISNYISDSGTVVVWSNYDKQIETFETIVKESHIWIGRTFRKFIWGEAEGYDEIQITLNNKIVKAIDPLYVNKKKTGFENEDCAELLTPQIIPWKIPLEDVSSKQKSDIKINISLLPDAYRRTRGAGGDQFANERFVDRNEGISILRKDREVFFGLMPRANKLNGSSDGDRNVTRFIGCEISFNPELDSEFEVKNIKRGCVPARELKQELIDKLSPTFTTLRERIRNRWSEFDREKETETSSQNSDIGISSTHSTTNKFLKEAKNSLMKGNKINNQDKDEKIGKKINPKASNSEIEKVIQGLRENGITIDEKEFIGDSFIDIEHGNQLKTLFYNTNSTFYKAYNDILDELKNQNEELATKYKVLLDLIFVGYVLAESSIDPNETMDGASFTDEIKQYWSINLSKILKKWNT